MYYVYVVSADDDLLGVCTALASAKYRCREDHGKPFTDEWERHDPHTWINGESGVGYMVRRARWRG